MPQPSWAEEWWLTVLAPWLPPAPHTNTAACGADTPVDGVVSSPPSPPSSPPPPTPAQWRCWLLQYLGGGGPLPVPLYRTPFTEAPVDWHGPPPPTIVAAVQQDPVAAAAAPLLAKGAKALHIPLLFQPAPLLTALGSTSSLASRLITSTLSCVPLAALVQMHVLPTAAVKPEDALLKTLQWLSHVPKLFMELLWLAGAALPGGQSAQLSIPKEQLLRAVVDMEAKHWPNLKRWGGKASRLHITLDALQVAFGFTPMQLPLIVYSYRPQVVALVYALTRWPVLAEWPGDGWACLLRTLTGYNVKFGPPFSRMDCFRSLMVAATHADCRAGLARPENAAPLWQLFHWAVTTTDMPIHEAHSTTNEEIRLHVEAVLKTLVLWGACLTAPAPAGTTAGAPAGSDAGDGRDGCDGPSAMILLLNWVRGIVADMVCNRRFLDDTVAAILRQLVDLFTLRQHEGLCAILAGRPARRAAAAASHDPDPTGAATAPHTMWVQLETADPDAVQHIGPRPTTPLPASRQRGSGWSVGISAGAGAAGGSGESVSEAAQLLPSAAATAYAYGEKAAGEDGGEGEEGEEAGARLKRWLVAAVATFQPDAARHWKQQPGLRAVVRRVLGPGFTAAATGSPEPTLTSPNDKGKERRRWCWSGS